jgi:hypothetical protein
MTDDLWLFPKLRRVWNEMVANDYRFVTWELGGAGRGISAGIRIAD